ncbi:hypothetical protein GGS21DRAFT_73288 [Xylaria nigripes]|nr:hypothetical protein GGS21DRAFT_73288 [Xylaria nigripes]
MRYLALLTPFLLGATAFPLKQRQINTQANVSGFTASTSEGNGAFFAYDLQIEDVVNTHCEYSDDISVSNLPNVPQVNCDDPAVRWQFNQDPSRPGTEGLYRIVIIYTTESPNVVVAGWHEWQPTDFPVSASGETQYQGATDFSVTLTA